MSRTISSNSIHAQHLVGATATIQRALGRCYELSLSSLPPFRRLFSLTGIIAIVCSAARKFLIRIADPKALVYTPYGLTQMPLSHELPKYYFWHPLYDSVISRLSSHIRETEGSLGLIDIGANIGDSALCARLTKGDSALLVEPTQRFRECASINIEQVNGNVELLNYFVGAIESKKQIQTLAQRGTARFHFATQGTNVAVCTVDKLMRDRPNLRVNFIKIDTDGHDLNCLQGAQQTIADFRPYVLIESDVFNSEDYCKDFFGCCRHFSNCGYERAIFYSNIGHFVWCGPITDISIMAQLLFYHVTSGVLYYDILFLPPSSSFPEHEREFFCGRPLQQGKRVAAHSCLDWIA